MIRAVGKARIALHTSAVRSAVSRRGAAQFSASRTASSLLRSASAASGCSDGFRGGSSGGAGGSAHAGAGVHGGLFGALVALTGGVLAWLGVSSPSSADNCGIVGVVGSEDVAPILLEGLSILQSRGYDSAGIATIGSSGDLEITKYASRDSTADSIDLVKKDCSHHRNHRIGIAHTRWATHGGRTDANAHPHSDMKNRIALIHNGVISNSHELKKELVQKGIKFRSETDTEVIAQLIGVHLDEGMSLKVATSHALSRCEGTWGIAVLSKQEPDEVVVAANGSPMVIGIGQGATYIASETAAFSRYTKNFIAMKDGEIGTVRADASSLDLSRVEVAPDHDILLSPAPYPHFTIRECFEQPEAIARALGYGGRMTEDRVILGGPDRQKHKLKNIQNMMLTGCGTSLHAAMFGAKLMRELDCFDTVTAIDSAEVVRASFPRAQTGGVLAISQSGETKDVHRAVKIADEEGLTTLSVVNAVGSLIARTTGLGIYLNAGREHAVASTKAFSSQVTALALLAVWFRQLREDTEGLAPLPAKREMLQALQRLPISFGMATRTREHCKRIAKELKDKHHLFVLGKGYGEPIAYEGALKIKEMAYLHAEGYSGGALKHGPFALIEDKTGEDGATPIIMLVLDDDHAERMRIAAEEVKARGARVFIITDNPKLAEGIDNDPVIIPSNGPLTALIAVLPLQLIAYELALLRGINPDVPRNLAKAVTTD